MPAQPNVPQDIVIRGGHCLLPGRGLIATDLFCAEGKIARIGHDRGSGARVIDASGCLVLPGIVDIHGDAFERQIMPRPKTMFPLDIALIETDRQLAANGITTAYHGITVSWEPGLRSLEEAMRIIESLDRIDRHLLVDHRLHVRWETFALDEMEDVQALFARGKKPLLAFNDHTGPTLAGARKDHKVRGAAERAMVDIETYWELLGHAGERAGEVPDAIRSMAAAAREQGVAMLSHDDRTPAERASFRAMGARIAEFPMNAETLEEAADAGDMIVLGAPNVVRGGSHNGAIGAEDAIRQERCAVLASDYYYPAPLQAAIALNDRGTLPLERAWELISSAPASAAGLADRGVIAEGLRADLLVLPEGGTRPIATLCGGQVVYASI